MNIMDIIGVLSVTAFVLALIELMKNIKNNRPLNQSGRLG